MSKSLFEILCQILKEEGWKYECDTKNEIVRLEIHGTNSDYTSFIIVDEEQESLLCNTHIRQKIPYSKRLELCNFMNRVNYELAIGNFEMDMDDGEIRFRTYLDSANAEPTKEQLLNLIWNGAQAFDTYYPGLLKIITTDFSSEEALELCFEI